MEPLFPVSREGTVLKRQNENRNSTYWVQIRVYGRVMQIMAKKEFYNILLRINCANKIIIQKGGAERDTLSMIYL